MGTPKQMLPYQGRSLIRYLTETAIASFCSPIIVVLGAYAEQIRPEISQLPLQIVENHDWQQGMNTSIRRGMECLKTISEPIEAVVILVCDQPFVSTQIINQLVEAYHATGKAIIASEYAHTLGVPTLFKAHFFSELMTLKPNQGAKQIIQAHHQDVFPLAFPEGVIDLDTSDDYAKLF